MLSDSDEQAIRQTLSCIRPFTEWPDDAIAFLCRDASIQSYDVGAYVYRTGDQPKGLWIVHNGWFQVSRTWASGKKWVLDHQQPGQLTGIVSLLDGMPAPFDVVARVPASMIFIPKASFLETFQRQPALMFGIAELMARRARMDYARHFALAVNSPRVLVAKVILYMIRGKISTTAAPIEVPVNIPQEDFALLLNMRRQTVNRELGWLANAGVLERHYRKLIVVDVARLLKVVNEEEPLDVFEQAVTAPKGKVLDTAM